MKRTSPRSGRARPRRSGFGKTTRRAGAIALRATMRKPDTIPPIGAARLIRGQLDVG